MHTILIVKFLSKNSILTKPQQFYEFFTQFFFWQFFSWNQSCQQLKSPKPQHFHEFFTQKNWQFSREIKVEFLDKKMKISNSVRQLTIFLFFSLAMIEDDLKRKKSKEAEKAKEQKETKHTRKSPKPNRRSLDVEKLTKHPSPKHEPKAKGHGKKGWSSKTNTKEEIPK